MRGGISPKPWSVPMSRVLASSPGGGVRIHVSLSLEQVAFVLRSPCKGCFAELSMINRKILHKSRTAVAVDSFPRAMNSDRDGYVL